MAERLPLNAMQAFEAAARSGSFVLAGEALGVSAAAISQHIRVLEGRFGKQLFHRHANGIELTDAGRELFRRVSGAFAELGEAAAHLSAGASRPAAVISVIPSVGELWLLPRLAALPGRASGIQVIEESADPIDFAARGVDIRITYGATAYPHHAVEVLFQDRMLPVAAPAIAAGLVDGAAAARDDILIHANWGPTYANAQSWAEWHAAIGSARRPDAGKGIAVERLIAAATAARCGLGVALLPESLVAADVDRETLTPVGPPAALLPQPYVMIARPAARLRPGADPVWRHLLAGARRTG